MPTTDALNAVTATATDAAPVSTAPVETDVKTDAPTSTTGAVTETKPDENADMAALVKRQQAQIRGQQAQLKQLREKQSQGEPLTKAEKAEVKKIERDNLEREVNEDGEVKLYGTFVSPEFAKAHESLIESQEALQSQLADLQGKLDGRDRNQSEEKIESQRQTVRDASANAIAELVLSRAPATMSTEDKEMAGNMAAMIGGLLLGETDLEDDKLPDMVAEIGQAIATHYEKLGAAYATAHIAAGVKAKETEPSTPDAPHGVPSPTAESKLSETERNRLREQRVANAVAASAKARGRAG